MKHVFMLLFYYLFSSNREYKTLAATGRSLV